MTTTTTIAARGAATARFWGMALLGSAVLAASAQISLPMWPVPATLQTLAVPTAVVGGEDEGAVAPTQARAALSS